jgi:hypothetical protein
VTFDIDEVSPPVTKSLHAQHRLHQIQGTTTTCPIL